MTHFICRVQDSINDYREVQSTYFDGSEDEAREYFINNPKSGVSRYFGDTRYQITMQANSEILQWPEE